MAETYKPLINYWPEHIAELRELIAQDAAGDEELRLLWSAAGSTMDSMFLSTMSADDCAVLEDMLGITPNVADTLDDRRRRLKGYFMSNLPYTQNKLIEVLNVLCGSSDGYTLEVLPAEYKIKVGVKLSNVRLYDNVAEIVGRMVPANIIRNVFVVFNRHRQLHRYTHGELAAYTHEQLRSDPALQEDSDT